jgi:hypothetical protein
MQPMLQISPGRPQTILKGGSMRRTLIGIVLSLAGLTLVLSSALASGPPQRTPDAKAVPLLGTAKVTLVQGLK